MFESLGWGELTVLFVLLLFVVGPERLPTVAAQAGRRLREAKRYLTRVTDELTAELGPELGAIDLRALHPTDLAATLLSDDGDAGVLGGGRAGRGGGRAVPPAPATGVAHRPPVEHSGQGIEAHRP